MMPDDVTGRTPNESEERAVRGSRAAAGNSASDASSDSFEAPPMVDSIEPGLTDEEMNKAFESMELARQAPVEAPGPSDDELIAATQEAELDHAASQALEKAQRDNPGRFQQAELEGSAKDPDRPSAEDGDVRSRLENAAAGASTENPYQSDRFRPTELMVAANRAAAEGRFESADTHPGNQQGSAGDEQIAALDVTADSEVQPLHVTPDETRSYNTVGAAAVADISGPSDEELNRAFDNLELAQQAPVEVPGPSDDELIKATEEAEWDHAGAQALDQYERQQAEFGRLANEIDALEPEERGTVRPEGEQVNPAVEATRAADAQLAGGTDVGMDAPPEADEARQQAPSDVQAHLEDLASLSSASAGGESLRVSEVDHALGEAYAVHIADAVGATPDDHPVLQHLDREALEDALIDSSVAVHAGIEAGYPNAAIDSKAVVGALVENFEQYNEAGPDIDAVVNRLGPSFENPAENAARGEQAQAASAAAYEAVQPGAVQQDVEMDDVFNDAGSAVSSRASVMEEPAPVEAAAEPVAVNEHGPANAVEAQQLQEIQPQEQQVQAQVSQQPDAGASSSAHQLDERDRSVQHGR
jgi:hypothetical protein